MGKGTALLHSAAVQLIDDSSDKWIIERSDNQLRVLRNGQLIEDAQLRQALLSNLLEDAEGGIVTLKLSEYDDRLEATFDHDQSKSLRSVAGAIREQLQLKIKQIVNLWDQPLFGDVAKIVQARDMLEGVYLAFREVLRQRRSLLADVQALDSFDDKLITQLQRDVSLIRQMEEIAAPLLDPAQAPRLRKEKIQAVEQELAQHFAGIAAIDVHFNIAEIPWEKLISCLSKIEAFERLIEASERAQQLCGDRYNLFRRVCGYPRNLAKYRFTNNCRVRKLFNQFKSATGGCPATCKNSSVRLPSEIYQTICGCSAGRICSGKTKSAGNGSYGDRLCINPPW